MLINVPVSIGELFDKISILDIKTKKIKNKDDLKLIKYELSKLKKIAKSKGLTSTKIKRKYLLLKSINEKLWNIENKKRKCESEKKFDSDFIDLSRQVYKSNDMRAKIKFKINEILKSNIREVKSHF